MPTDTVYGIAVDPLNDEAMETLFRLKGRPERKPIGVLVASREQAERIGELTGAAAALADRYWPGALTLVVRPKVILSDWVGDAQARTVGLRVPDHPVILELMERFGPLAVTSANPSGGADTVDHHQAEEVFGTDVSVYLEGTCPGGTGSTVVDATGPDLVILRQGPLILDRG